MVALQGDVLVTPGGRRQETVTRDAARSERLWSERVTSSGDPTRSWASDGSMPKTELVAMGTP